MTVEMDYRRLQSKWKRKQKKVAEEPETDETRKDLRWCPACETWADEDHLCFK